MLNSKYMSEQMNYKGMYTFSIFLIEDEKPRRHLEW